MHRRASAPDAPANITCCTRLRPLAIILPSEIQAREFDAKLLLACFLAEHGHSTIVGARHEIHANIHHLPRSVYVAKDIRTSSLRMVEILKALGHRIAAWDEEGLLTFSRELYYARRVDAKVVGQVERFFAWGPENKALIEGAPGYAGAPVHVTGNPRSDLCRRELRGLHLQDVKRLQDRFGRFILLNSNFGSVNHKVRSQTTGPGRPDAKGRYEPTPDMDSALRHRQQMFGIFRDLLPRLADAFEDRKIVVRPHPAEDHDAWRAAAQAHDNIEVLHEGAVLPWLLASGVTVHNGCSTGIEAFLLDRPAISFQPHGVEARPPALSDRLSHAAETPDDLFAMMRNCLDGAVGLPQTGAQRKILAGILAATDGPLASQRIADHLSAALKDEAGGGRAGRRFSGAFSARRRKAHKFLQGLIPGHKAGRAHNRHRFPGLDCAEVNTKITRFAEMLGRFNGVSARPVRKQIFEISRP